MKLRAQKNNGHLLRSAACLGLLSLCIMLATGCGRSSRQDEVILARIGDKTLSVDEFIRRAEYTIRPPYCLGSDAVQKKIVLNSLIAEKLMAMEAGEENALLRNHRVSMQLRGRKEQAMRQVQFFTEAYDHAVPDTAHIKKHVQNAGRVYDIAYFNVNSVANRTVVDSVLKASHGRFEAAFKCLVPLAEMPSRRVTWAAYENDAIMDSLYMRPLKTGDQVGPVHVGQNEWVYIQIKGMTQSGVLTQEVFEERWRKATERLRERDAKKYYEAYIRKVMKGRSITFNPETFKALTQILGPVYFLSTKEKKAFANQSVWGSDDPQAQTADALARLEILNPQSLFQVGENTWTVAELMQALEAHPLVFRNKSMKKKEFGRELQLAIVDLVRDTHLNTEAYKKGYDQRPSVQREVGMWRDYYGYLFHKRQYLDTVLPDSVQNLNPLHVIDRYLNAYVDSLQQKYSDQIEINLNALEKIQLTRTHMSVTRTHVPFVKPVPSFPMVTNRMRLNYGKRMEVDGLEPRSR